MDENGRTASRTAVLVCQGRAAADGRAAVGRFADPVAIRLLRPEERTVVDLVRAGTPPEGWQARTGYESVRACAEIAVPRTVAIDEALRTGPGAGLVAGADVGSASGTGAGSASGTGVGSATGTGVGPATGTGVGPATGADAGPATGADAGTEAGVDAGVGRQLVILGAGLDTRAWRLAELARTDVWEVDHPASQQDKRARLAAAEARPTARAVHFTAVDFAVDDLSAALDAAGHDPAAPTTWLWEGVIPYLTRAQVAVTLAALAARTAPGSTLVLNYQSPSAKAAAGRLLTRLLGNSVTAGEPWRSLWTPGRMAALLADHGLHVTSDHDLLTLARALDTPTRSRSSLRTGRVAVAVATPRRPGPPAH
ncbi:class I SAM-dependent methyltransferase [Kitasatospora sp. NA04385]|uniref:class I SAM-dependent methyltransferase n=1 Tax=Kitasatospora sp. NA04385 TaxID=2742135 RepID=UPI001590F8DF|nr:class I SAM-dependent methyltransferase [Kitasatospora sp. NA04385]QKW18398.1 class I SAM-dependent methyltransferase [Kitasatospora sp. NA04385]